MAGIEITRTMEVKELHRLARLEKSGRVAMRLLAIANVLSGMSREVSAKLVGMERQTLRDWVRRFNDEGVEGLRDRPRSGRPCELEEEHAKRFSAIVEAGPDPEKDGLVRWRRIDLKKWLKEECGLEYHERSVGKLLKRLGYSRISVRPVHPKAEAARMEDFKKTSPRRLSTRSRKKLEARTLNSGSRTRRASDRKER